MAVWKQLLLCVVVLVIAGGGWYAYQHRDALFGGAEGQQAAGAGGQQGGAGGGRRGGFAAGPTLVVSAPVGSDIVTDNVRAVGTVLVPQSINVYPQVTAEVTEILFKAGDKVAKGQALVRLDDADQKVALDLAQVALSDAKKTLDRSQKLANTNNLTLSALQDAQSAERRGEIGVLSAQIALDRRTINAPFEGVVGISNLSIGDLVTPTTVITTLDDPSVMKVTFLIPERYAGRVALGQAITALAESKPGTVINGKLTAIDTRVDSTARTLKLEATLDAAAAQAIGVRPGMAIKVELPFPGDKQLAVSALSIQWDRSGSYVWKVAGDGVARAPITILERQSGRVLVASDDLKEGDRIIVEGLQRLRPGVKIAEAGQASDVKPAASGGNGAKPLAQGS
ncbi:efflux RND transporter periplasmic adaptor subunit [Mesorhizobium sp. BR1-1-16]|uniref:efflux RND transporter periplasmic adaptor subunit n=1 Tax=Mesorhizobium sp. BR1-1-16 TaxID=2876653 RepID=UPI001CCCBB17|nr:efflux RND transporter periplasmic adaptor subunit [Mesorhizobium sp. BR1-1-16]MBZ9934922.1 efflux RND transporter periplasmic adaptor subunit [Mesorhizobium sp. BR1-1-16]